MKTRIITLLVVAVVLLSFSFVGEKDSTHPAANSTKGSKLMVDKGQFD